MATRRTSADRGAPPERPGPRRRKHAGRTYEERRAERRQALVDTLARLMALAES